MKLCSMRLAISWTWYRSISGLQPEMGTKMAEKWILASPGKMGENGKNGPKMGKMARNSILSHFRATFPILGAIFPHFLDEARSHFSAIFVPISGQVPNGYVASPRDCNMRPCQRLSLSFFFLSDLAYFYLQSTSFKTLLERAHLRTLLSRLSSGSAGPYKLEKTIFAIATSSRSGLDCHVGFKGRRGCMFMISCKEGVIFFNMSFISLPCGFAFDFSVLSACILSRALLFFSLSLPFCSLALFLASHSISPPISLPESISIFTCIQPRVSLYLSTPGSLSLLLSLSFLSIRGSQEEWQSKWGQKHTKCWSPELCWEHARKGRKEVSTVWIFLAWVSANLFWAFLRGMVATTCDALNRPLVIAHAHRISVEAPFDTSKRQL